jgi:hypothetical protein
MAGGGEYKVKVEGYKVGIARVEERGRERMKD